MLFRSGKKSLSNIAMLRVGLTVRCLTRSPQCAFFGLFQIQHRGQTDRQTAGKNEGRSETVFDTRRRHHSDTGRSVTLSMKRDRITSSLCYRQTRGEESERTNVLVWGDMGANI